MTQAETSDFADFYTANFSRIAAQLYAYLGDHAEAQDITQEAFCRALDRWRKVSGYENALAWVRQVAWNLATSRLRHLQVAMRHLARQRPQHVEGPGPDRVALTRALATLPPNHRLAIVLHHVEQMSIAEIAEQRGVAEGTVRSWLSRGRSQLADYFVEPLDWEAPAFQPEGPAAAAVKVRRRRTVRRSALAAVIVVLVALPITIFLLRGGGDPPIIGPTTPPNPSPSVSLPVETRRASLPVADMDSPNVSFVDGRNGWIFYSSCRFPASQVQCRHALGTTSDGGRTWRTTGLPPDVPTDADLGMQALDANTVVLEQREGEGNVTAYWLSVDRGATFRKHRASQPPVELLRFQGGRYQMLCPGTTYLDYATDKCDRLDLIEVGKGKLPNQPPWRGNSIKVLNGRDGRLWLWDQQRSTMVAVSADNAKTWREMPWPTGGRFLPMFSADGDLWAMGAGSFWKWDGTEWRLRFTADVDLGTPPMLLGDDVWLAARAGKAHYLKDGHWTPVPQIDVAVVGGRVLPDGTVLLATQSGAAAPPEQYLGVGQGMHREWVRVIAAPAS